MKIFRHFVCLLALIPVIACSKTPPPQTDSFTELASAGPTCAIVNGVLNCTGNNSLGSLGNGLIIDSARPVKTQIGGKLEHVAVGSAHACVVSDGVPYCWGYNGYGSTGTGDVGTDHIVPARVSGTFTNLKELKAWSNETCALSDEGMQCWGSLVNIGHGTNATPVSISLPGTATSMAMGTYQTCVLINGGVYCWGRNGYGQLGRGTISNDETSVVIVTGLESGVKKIVGLSYSMCALLDSGSVKCWGANEYGQLGNNSTTNSSTPVDVSRLTSGVTDIEGGSWSVIAVANDQAFTWGRNEHGELGDGSTTNSPVPVAVTGLPGTPEILTAGVQYFCALLSSKVYCWGDAGSLGVGRFFKPRPTPSLAGPWVP